MRLLKKQTTKLWIVLIMGMVSCIGGIVYAVHFGRAVDGGRGGAVAVAAAFLALFTSTHAIEDLLEAPGDEQQLRFDQLPVEQQVERLKAGLASVIDATNEQNIFLAITSVIGTMVWAFGDAIAAWFGAPQ